MAKVPNESKATLFIFLMIGLWATFWGTIFYVAWHFIEKFW